MKIKAAVTREVGGEFRIEEVNLAEPKEGEILVKIASCGICSADLAARDQLHPIALPAVLGHEGAGVVEAVGGGVNEIKPGDHVVLHAYSCGNCAPCLNGHPAYCLNQGRVNFGGFHSDGTHRLSDANGTPLSTFFNQSSFATYSVASVRNAVKVDDDVDLSILGPLGCGINTGAGTIINKLRPKVGDSFALFGCGSVGLSALMAARLAGCYPIIGIDVVESRLALAKELGATHVINSKKTENVEEAVKEISDGGADYCLDTTALPAIVNTALYATKPGGTVAIVGTSGEIATSIVLHEAIMANMRSLVGVVQGDSVPKLFIPRLIKLYKLGLFPFDKLISFYDFDDINKAAEDTRSGVAIKPVLRP